MTEERVPLPDRRMSMVRKFQWQQKSWLIDVGFDHDGHVREVFMAGSKSGSEVNGLITDACILLSLLLQMGQRPAWICGRLATPLPSDIVGAGPELSSLIGAVAAQAAILERDHGEMMARTYAALNGAAA